jgi:hypothetical protein
MSARRIELVVTRSQVLIGLAMLKSFKAPGAFLLSKVEKFVASMLEKFPEDTFRFTVEAIDEEKKEESHGEAKA